MDRHSSSSSSSLLASLSRQSADLGRALREADVVLEQVEDARTGEGAEEAETEARELAGRIDR